MQNRPVFTSYRRAGFRALGASSMLAVALLQAEAQVEHKHLFKPKATIPITVDAPADVEARRDAFAARNRPENLTALADELFGMMNLDWKPENPGLRERFQAAAEAYRAGHHAEALDAYKRFYLQRVLDSGARGRDPKARTFIEYFTEAEGLMRGQALFAAFTVDYPDDIIRQGVDGMLNYYRAGHHDDFHVLLALAIGEPGTVNWTYSLKEHYGTTWHMPRDESYLSVAYAGRDVLTPLIAAYVDSRDPAFLQRWADYVDDFHLNFIRDVQRSSWADELNWSNIYGPALEPVIFAVREIPEAIDTLPAATLARIAIHEWTANIPNQIQLSRTAGPNRRLTMNGRSMNAYYAQYPELAQRDYLLRQRRRTLEDHTRVAIHPDGTDQILALPYYDQYLTTPPNDIAELKGLPEAPWLTDRWEQEIRRTQNLVASYLIRNMDPANRMPGHRDALRDLVAAKGMAHPQKGMHKLAPEMMAKPENQAIMAWRTGHRPTDVPLRSLAFPFGGAYFIWSDWSEQPQFMHFTSQREGTRNRWRFNNNIWLVAYNQLMLFYSAHDYVLEVDGVGGVAETDIRAMPELVPQPNRFLSSEHFDFVEGSMTDNSRSHLDPQTGTSKPVGPVDHQRQILFVRDAGIWIVTDRFAGQRPHDYRLLWPFRGDFHFAKGSEDIRKRIRVAPENSYLHGYRPDQDFAFDTDNKIIRTVSPHIPNLSIYHTSNRTLSLPIGEFVQHNWRFGNALGTGPRIENATNAVLASLLFPRKDLDEDLTSFHPVEADGIAGFDALTQSGHRVAYRAAGQSAQRLSAGPVEVNGEALLISGRDGEPAFRGVALGVKSFALDGKPIAAPSANVSFQHQADGQLAFEAIHYPMEMVRIEPAADRFAERLTVTLSHPETDVDIRYTLDGSMPGIDSPLYTRPFEIDATTWVTAIAIRKGTTRLIDSTDSVTYSIPHWAIYEKEPYRKPATQRPATGQTGLHAVYKETSKPISMINFKGIKATREGAASTVFDLGLRAGSDPVSNYGFTYSGYVEVPEDGTYNFHAPEEFVSAVIFAWYDLRIFLNGEEWYPATRRQNFGTWSVPLKAGSHRIEIQWVDQRPSMGIVAGRPPSGSFSNFYDPAPVLEFSGPGIPRQPLPSHLLWHTPE